MTQGTLFVVSTPIGNYADLTLRAERVLRECDVVVCEERRAGSTLLAHFKIEKALFELNEHSRTDDVDELLALLRGGKTLALISDHGTPLIQDPGKELVSRAIEAQVRVEPIPGASAILAALVASGIPAPRFRFVGNLPQKSRERALALKELSAARETLLFLDAPYRLMVVLDGLRTALGQDRRACVACNLTLDDENFVRGTLGEIHEYFRMNPFKGEFVIIVQGITK